MKFSPKQREALSLVEEGRFYPTFVREEDGWHARWRALGGVGNDWVDEYVRSAAMTRLSEDAEEQRHETLHDAWLMALKSRTGLVVWDDDECAAFADELARWSGNAEEDVAARQCIRFRFEPGEAGFSIACECPWRRRLLKALGQATYVFFPLRGLRRGRVALTRTEAEDFVRRGARDLRDAGYVVEGVDLAAPITAEAEVSGGDAPRVALTVRVDGEPVTAAEVRFLLDQGSTLVFFRDRWIEVDRGILKEALRALEKGVDRKTPPISFALGLGHVGSLEIETARLHGGLRGLVNDLRQRGELSSAAPSCTMPGFVGELREYQKRGVEWLNFLTSHGFGALLADDMGLGKTIQVIAYILSRPPAKTLIVAPLTLLSNWCHELARFAPSILVYVHQGHDRPTLTTFRRAVMAADVTLTSYNLLVKDYDGFAAIGWDTLVLDEAQAIKNPDTQAARAAVALSPPNRIALTGTPIENTVADIWSIERFLNPGFLGERRDFAKRFVQPIAMDGACTAARRLKRALEPFVLRRLKSDGRIAAELGEKREIRDYCELTPEQRYEYERALEDYRAVEHAPGDVFALLTRLKLICDGAAKLERLVGLLETVFANGESALVFTQYAKVGAVLKRELEKRFGKRFPFLHGGLTVEEREREIERFRRRGATAFVLSLKAGGFGLNLTKATHVIHFDRWWNPAVEQQATDRAHRIGQVNTVFVHYLISSGTMEERIDGMLERKRAVAESVITEQEWLSTIFGEKKPKDVL